jgi:hypothetical protein
MNVCNLVDNGSGKVVHVVRILLLAKQDTFEVEHFHPIKWSTCVVSVTIREASKGHRKRMTMNELTILRDAIPIWNNPYSWYFLNGKSSQKRHTRTINSLSN